eukprot:gene9974-13415_t
MNVPYNLVLRFSIPKQSQNSSQPSLYPPVCIPNGLGATMVVISKIQELLNERGFTVLSYDRYGVGFSDDNKSNKYPTAKDLINEMEYVMNSVMPPDTKWILLGPSMGSIIAQCYIATYPEKVIGFLNMDGLPYPFILQKNHFLWAGFIYKLYTYVIWTGLFRPFIAMALQTNSEMFQSKLFSIEIAKAQLNQSRFFSNISLEMSTMMDCCEMAEQAWGFQSILKLPKKDLKALICAPPTRSIEINPITSERSIVTTRSISEMGESWIEAEIVNETITNLTNKNQSKSIESSLVHTNNS